MNDTQLFAFTSVICVIVSYLASVGAVTPDPKQSTSTLASESSSATMAIPGSTSGSWLATEVTIKISDENYNHPTRWRRCFGGGGLPFGPPGNGPPSPDKPPSGGPPSFKPPFGGPPFGGPPFGGPPPDNPPPGKPPSGGPPFGGPPFGGPPFGGPPFGGPPPDKPPSGNSTTEKTKTETKISKAIREATKTFVQGGPPSDSPPPSKPPSGSSTTEKTTIETEISKLSKLKTLETFVQGQPPPPPPPPTTTPPPPPGGPPSTSKKSTTEVEITKNGSTTSKIEASISLLPPGQVPPPPPPTTTPPPPPSAPPSTTEKSTTEVEITKNGSTTSKIEASISLLPPGQAPPPPPTTTPPPPPGGPPSTSEKTTTEFEITKNGYKYTTGEIEESLALLPPGQPGPPPTTTPPPPSVDPPAGASPPESKSISTVGNIVTQSMSTSETAKTLNGDSQPIIMNSDASGIYSITTPSSIKPTISIDSTTTSTNTSLSSVISAIVSYSTSAGADPPDPKQKFKDTTIGSAINKILPDGEIKDKFDKLQNQDFVQISSVISAIVSYSTIVGINPPDPKQKVKDTTIGSMISKLLPDGEVKDQFDKLENQDISQISSVISAIVSYSINVGADPLDPKQKVKDTTIGSAISNILPDGEIKDKFDKLENQDVMDTMELLGQASNMQNIDEFLGKLYEKNPEAANFVKVVLKKLGCSEDDATMSCKAFIEYKDQILSGLTALNADAETASQFMQSLTG